MSYRVLITLPARRDLRDAFGWIARSSPRRAQVWLRGARQAIQTLADFPRRCPLAPGDGDSDLEIRQLLYGHYRILFTIDGEVVRVYHVRHGARRSLAPGDF